MIGCQYIFKIGPKKGDICQVPCRGEFCKSHKPRHALAVAAYYNDHREEIQQNAQMNRQVHQERNKIRDKEKRDRQRANDPVFMIKHKLSTSKTIDRKHNRPFLDEGYVTLEWCQNQLLISNNTCHICETEILICGFEKNSFDQFSIDRLDNSKAHTKENCQIICWGCNLDKVRA